MNNKISGRIIRALENYHGEVAPDLRFSDIYELTVAVVLSAQTTDIQVNRVSAELFAAYPDFSALASAETEAVKKIIRSTGFYAKKSENIIALSKIIMGRFNGEVPSDFNSLTELPGIGRKTANVILAEGFGKNVIAVDTHVRRVSNRLGYSSSTDIRRIEEDLYRYIEEGKRRKINLLFIRHGRRICKALKPACGDCPAATLCLHANS